MEPFTPATPAVPATRTLVLQISLVVDQRGPLDGDLVYDPRDPYAVQLRVRPPAGPPVVWSFARDLVVEGLHAPAGDGDVLVWPCLGTEGEAVVVIELRSPSGTAMLQTTARPVHEFVRQVLDAVPLGHETERIDLDEMVRHLLAA